MSENRTNLEILRRPFPRNIVKQRQGAGGKTFDYVPGEAVLQQLMEATEDVFDFTVTDPPRWHDDGKKGFWIVGVSVTIPGLGTRPGIGTAVAETEDSPKAAFTDALKIACKHFGVALELYMDKRPAVQRPANAPSSHAAQRNAHQVANEPQGMGADEAQAKFWELARRFGQTQATLDEEQIREFLSALNDGPYPNSWDAMTWTKLARPLAAFWKAACAADPALKERGKIPVAFISKCAQIEFADDSPASVTAIRGEQWKLMSDRIPHYLEVIEDEATRKQ